MKENREEELLIEEVNDLISMIEEACADGQQKQVEILTDQLEKALYLLTALNHKKKQNRIMNAEKDVSKSK